MDFKFKIKLDKKVHKAAVHHPTPAAITLAVRNIFYRHFKTDAIDIPYIGDTQLQDFIDCGYLELLGVTIDGERLDSIKIESDDS